jgi:hypothetical protein
VLTKKNKFSKRLHKVPGDEVTATQVTPNLKVQCYLVKLFSIALLYTAGVK